MRIKIPQLPNIKFKFSRDEWGNILKSILSITNIPIIIVIGLVILNIFSQYFFLRLDLTDEGNYSLSSATKNIISKLPDDVILEVYFSDNIPPNLSEIRQQVYDLYEEYAKSSDGKITFDLKSPQSSDFESEAQSRGLTQIQFSEFSQDSYEVARGYLGAAIVKGSEVEAIPVLSSVSNLEYETTSKIVKLTSDQTVKIGFLTGHEEYTLISDLVEINEYLQSQYVTETVDLSEGKPIDPEEIKVLVIPGPRKALSERDQFELEQYLFAGGRIIVLEDLLKMSSDLPVLAKTESNTNDFLKNYGLEVETKVLLDKSFTPITAGISQIEYPYWVLLTEEGINSSLPPFSELQTSTFIWSNPVKKIEKDGITHTELFTTTEFAWTESGESIDINFKDFIPTEQKKYSLAYLAEGKTESVFKDKDIPLLSDTTKVDQRTSETVRINEGKDIKLAVIGDADFVTSNFINANEQNPVLILNLIEWMANNNELASIRSKNITTRPLQTVSDNERTIYKVANSALSPLSVVIIGILYSRRRKNRQPGI